MFRDLKCMMLAIWKFLHSVFFCWQGAGFTKQYFPHGGPPNSHRKIPGAELHCSQVLDCYSSEATCLIKGIRKFGYRSKHPPCLATLNRFGFYPPLITEHSYLTRIPWAMGATSCWILKKTCPITHVFSGKFQAGKEHLWTQPAWDVERW